MLDQSLLFFISLALAITTATFFTFWLLLLKKVHKLQMDKALLESQLQERERSFERESIQFELQKQQLSEHFNLLSQEILSVKAKQLEQHSQNSLQQVINPFSQSLENFKQEVQKIHHRETLQQGILQQELKQLKALNQQITTEAQQLSSALRGQNKLQGNWGELILESVLEQAGLEEGKNFTREQSFSTEDGRKRPDVIVYLPDNKHIIVDAKVSLTAYVDMVNSGDEESRTHSAKQHIASIKQHIKNLSSKEYEKISQLNAPEWIILFIPIESAFADAVRMDESLYQLALNERILVATPSTLLSCLQIIRQLWRYQEQNIHLQDIAGKVEGIYKKLNTFLISFHKIEKALKSANEAYTQAENQLVQGRGNLIKQVNDFKKLAPTINYDLPSEFTDKADLEISNTEQRENDDL